MRRHPPETPPSPRMGPTGDFRLTVPTGAAPGDVFARERQDEIARLVGEQGRVRVRDLATRFAVSTVTIRKDLVVLEHEGRLTRTHGGALLRARDRPEPAFDLRERLQQDEKARIGAAAAALVHDGDSHRHGREHHGPRRRPTHPGPGRLEPADGHHQRPPDRIRARRVAGDHRADDRRPRPPGGDVRGRAPGRRPVRADQRPDRVRRRRRVRRGAGALRRHRGGGPDQAIDGRRRPPRDRHRRPHQVAARGLRDVLPHRPDRRGPHRRPGAGRRWCASCAPATSRSRWCPRGPPHDRGRRARGRRRPPRPAHGHHQAVRRDPGAGRRVARPPRRRGPRARRRERRGQEHAGQDHGRRLPAGQRHDPGRRRAHGHQRARARPGARDRGGPPGAAPVPGPQRRRERVHRPRAVGAAADRRLGRHQARGEGAVRGARRPVRRPGPRSAGCRWPTSSSSRSRRPSRSTRAC